MTAVVEVTGVTKNFGKVTAVADATFAVEENSVCGLLGRNGAGKTTLMQLITGQDFASAGDIRLFGEQPVENARAIGRTSFIKESQTYPDGFRGSHVLRAASWAFPHWDASLADDLVKQFDPPLNRPMKKLSRGQRSAVGVIVGLASRAELTIFDEPYAGLDAVARQMFYDALLADYASHPRTIIMSTHLIDEASQLLNHVLLIDQGSIVIDEDAEALRGTAVTLAGKHADVEAFVVGRDVLAWDGIGGLASVTLTGVSEKDKAAALAAGLELAPVSLQQLVIGRTRTSGNGED
jgi:ABC-2 type transport system ATP-binding protein